MDKVGIGIVLAALVLLVLSLTTTGTMQFIAIMLLWPVGGLAVIVLAIAAAIFVASQG